MVETLAFWAKRRDEHAGMRADWFTPTSILPRQGGGGNSRQASGVTAGNPQ